MKIFNLPDLGEGLPDAEIVEWHVKEGDVVKEDQPMVSMETAKAVVDVPCPYSGVIAKLHGQPGDVIDTGAVLVEFSEEGATESAPTTPTENTTVENDSPAKLKEDIVELIDELEDKLPTQKTETIAVEEDSGTVVGAMESSNQVVSDIKAVGKFKIAPAVKALAKKLKVDLNDVTPTGPGGVIRPSDIKLAHKNKSNTQTATTPVAPEPQAVVEQPAQAPVSAPAAQKPATSSSNSTPTQPMSGDWEQVKGPRRAMARIMADSHAQIVPTTLMDDADIHNWSAGEDITARLIRAIVKGVEAEPALNSWFNGGKLARRIINHVDIGIAVDTPDGLFVPTMRNCDQKSAAEVRTRMNEIKGQVKDRSIPPEDMKDFTIMLSNFGVFAGRYATPVITPPCVAIIASGKLLHEVVPVLGGFEVHRMIPLSLTFDHRAVTGGEAARFLAAVIKDLQKSQ